MWTHEAAQLRSKSQDLAAPLKNPALALQFQHVFFFLCKSVLCSYHDCCSILSLNLPLDQSECVVPVWPWQSSPCQWSSATGSFRCAAAHLNIKRWSYDIVHQESGWTSQCPSLNGWLIGRYAVIKRDRSTRAWIDRNHFHIFIDSFFPFLYLVQFK